MPRINYTSLFIQQSHIRYQTGKVMDIFELLPLIIFGLIYLFGSSAKKKAEEAKRKTTAKGAPSVPEQKKGLQQRLEDALQEMQGRAGTGTASAPTRLERKEQEVEGESVENEIHRMTAEALYDRDLYSSPEESSSLLSEQPATESQFGFKSLMKEVPNETYHGHGFTNFNEEQGIHHDDNPLLEYDINMASMSDFQEAHGLHYGETTSGGAGSAYLLDSISGKGFFHDMNEVRRGIVLAEVLGKPKALR